MTANMAAVLRLQPPRPCVDEAATFRSLVIPPPRNLKLKYNRVSTSVKLRRRRGSSIVSELKNQSNIDNPPDGGEDSGGVKVALSMLRFYKREISPLMPNSCRYVPTCSEYSMEAYRKYGVVKGTVLTAWRLCRCNPLGGSGFDPPRWFDEERPVDE